MHPHAEVQQRLGLQVLFDFTDIVDAIRFAAEHGFRVLELNLANVAFSRQLRSVRARREIRAAARKHRVKLAAHAIDGPSFFIPDSRAVRCAVSGHKRVLDQAKEAGISRIVMHLGFEMRYGMDGGAAFLHEQYPELYRESVGNALTELKEHARGRAKLCVENVGGFRFEFVHELLDGLLGGNLGLCLDVGHVNVLSAGKRKTELAFFRRHWQHIAHVHLHDNHGKQDEHLALGDGTIDFVPFFRMLAPSEALMVFEVRPKEAALRCLEYYNRKEGLSRRTAPARTQSKGSRVRGSKGSGVLGSKGSRVLGSEGSRVGGKR